MTDDERTGDGRVLDPGRVADHLAIQDLATAYAYAVDDRDWPRWEALFVPDGPRKAIVRWRCSGGTRRARLPASSACCQAEIRSRSSSASV